MTSLIPPSSLLSFAFDLYVTANTLLFFQIFSFYSSPIVLDSSLPRGQRPNLATLFLGGLSYNFRDSEKVLLTLSPPVFPENFRARTSSFGVRFYVLRPFTFSVSESSGTNLRGEKKNTGTLNVQD